MNTVMNCNQHVRVTLTPTGLRALDKYEADMGLPERHRRLSVTDGDHWRGPLWQLMQEFGACIHMGMHEVPFVGNLVEFEHDADFPVVQRSEPGGYAEPTLKARK